MKIDLIKAKIQANWIYIVVAIIYVLVFLTIRIINVTDLPLHVDERRHIIRAQATIANGDIFIGLRESLKQLYIWVVAIALPFFKDFIFAARFASILMGLGAAAVCYKLAMALYNNRCIGLLAALFYLFSPMALFYDRLAFNESLLTMLMGASILFSFQLWQEATPKKAIILGATLGLAALAKAYALFYYIAPVLFWLLLGKNIEWRKILKLLTITYGVAFIAWIPIFAIGFDIFKEDHTQKLAIDVSTTARLEIISSNFLDNIYWISGYLTIPFIVFLLFSLILITIKKDKIGFIMMILLFVPIVGFTLIMSYQAMRYMMPTIIPMSIIIAWGIYNLAQLILLGLERITSNRIRKFVHPQILSIGIFLVLCIPSIWFDYLIITNVPLAPLPAKDKEVFVEGLFSGYGLKESAAVVADLASQYPKVIILQGTNLMDTIFSLEIIGMSLYLQNTENISTENISYKSISNINERTIQEINAYAQEAPTLTLGTFDSEGEHLPVFAPLFDDPRAWQIASFTKPGHLHQVKIYQWLLWPDFAIRWLQQGGDAEPRVAWYPTDESIATQNGTLINWPKNIEATPEGLQQTLTKLNVEYVLANANLINSQPNLFAPYIATEGTRLKLEQLPPNWYLSFVYPDIRCEWCLFHIKPPEHPTQITFNDTILLQGYDISATELSVGEMLHITLYWHSLAAQPESYVVFVHLVNEQGQLVGQVDQLPLQGKLPTNYWQNGSKLADRHTLELNPELPKGNYKILVGLYNSTTLERISVQSDQYLITDNAIELTPLIIR